MPDRQGIQRMDVGEQRENSVSRGRGWSTGGFCWRSKSPRIIASASLIPLPLPHPVCPPWPCEEHSINNRCLRNICWIAECLPFPILFRSTLISISYSHFGISDSRDFQESERFFWISRNQNFLPLRSVNVLSRSLKSMKLYIKFCPCAQVIRTSKELRWGFSFS